MHCVIVISAFPRTFALGRLSLAFSLLAFEVFSRFENLSITGALMRPVIGGEADAALAVVPFRTLATLRARALVENEGCTWDRDVVAAQREQMPVSGCDACQHLCTSWNLQFLQKPP